VLRYGVLMTLGGVLVVASISSAQAGSPRLLAGLDPGAIALAQTEPAPEPAAPIAERTDVAEVEEVEESFPVTLSLTYTLVTDYVYRGINYSEHDKEGREKLNHQLTTSLSFDLNALGLGDLGTLGFDTWWEWYADQDKINPYAGGDNLQEIDYTIWWSHAVDPIHTDVTLGLSFYTYPNLAKLLRDDDARGNNNDDRTVEWWFELAHNDAWMWQWLLADNEDAVLSPTFLFAQDVGAGAGAVWMELGISHEFEVPWIDYLTITPGYSLGIDGGLLKRYLGLSNPGHLRLANQQVSLNVDYDLTPLLQLPKWAGGVGLNGFLCFSDALGTAESDGTTQDEFWGGLNVTWTWGG